VGPDAGVRLAEWAETWGVETAIAAMQVLAETVSRARWTRQSRALADLALVRIATLQRLTEVSGWLQQLAEGSAAAVPSTGITQKKTAEVTTQDISPAVAAETTTPEPQPQTSDTKAAAAEDSGPEQAESVTEESEESEESKAEDVAVEAAAESTPFESGHEAVIWDEVTGRISGLLREHVERVDRVAISGPNRLDLVFAAEYDFHRRFCERPEEMRRLEQLLRDVTGDVVQVRLLVEEPKAEAVSEESAAIEEKPEATDPMVEEAQSIFGASVQRVVPINRPTSDD
jgi:DNA polymerase-3 subunit gamma/tau